MISVDTAIQFVLMFVGTVETSGVDIFSKSKQGGWELDLNLNNQEPLQITQHTYCRKDFGLHQLKINDKAEKGNLQVFRASFRSDTTKNRKYKH
jgi:hypothetical protein